MILKYLEYISEVSGTELVGAIGPAYGETRIQNKTINKDHTTMTMSKLNNRIYTLDDYNELYNEYIKRIGYIKREFSSENIDFMLSNLEKNF